MKQRAEKVPAQNGQRASGEARLFRWIALATAAVIAGGPVAHGVAAEEFYQGKMARSGAELQQIIGDMAKAPKAAVERCNALVRARNG